MHAHHLGRRAFLRLGAGAALAPLLGCRHLSVPTREGSAASATPSPPQAGAIILAVRTSNCQAPQFVADRRGLYAAQGLEVAVRPAPSNTEIVEALVRGDVQLGSLPVTTAIAAIARGAPVRIVATTGRGSDGLLVRAEGGPADLTELRGTRVATIRASILDVLLRHALEEAGMRLDRDVEPVYMSQLGDMIAALRTGQVAATSNTEPFMTEAERDGWGRILRYYTADWPDHPCCVLVAGSAWAAGHAEELERLLAAHHDAVTWATAHTPETARIIVDYLGMFDAPLVEASLHPSKMRLDDGIDPDEVERMAALMARYEIIDAAPAPGELVDLGPLRAALGIAP